MDDISYIHVNARAQNPEFCVLCRPTVGLTQIIFCHGKCVVVQPHSHRRATAPKEEGIIDTQLRAMMDASRSKTSDFIDRLFDDVIRRRHDDCAAAVAPPGGDRRTGCTTGSIRVGTVESGTCEGLVSGRSI